jgi:dTDP-4-dehydrorhamnose 3,5-epimerase
VSIGQEVLHGAKLIPLRAHADPRGSLTEVFREAWLPDPPRMVQANLSRSQTGVLRGLHFHRDQADYWIPVSGVAFVGLYDLREGSPTSRRKAEIRIDPASDPAGLYLPPGLAHGFYAETDLTLLYLVDREFTGDDEFGVAWDDPDVGIEWPSPEPTLSDRDRKNPSLAEVLAERPSSPGS